MNEETRQYIDDAIRRHDHRGFESLRLNLIDIFGLFETISATPTGKPTSAIDQVKIYKSGGTYRLYWYDALNDEWRYATGT